MPEHLIGSGVVLARYKVLVGRGRTDEEVGSSAAQFRPTDSMTAATGGLTCQVWGASTAKAMR